MIEPYFETGFGVLYHGKSENILPTLPDNSMDSIVTDPPYGLKFMGKKWDYKIPSVEVWRECFRVLKPGGWLLSFAGTRTQHRMACNIEDAGFEIRDMIAWVYSQGFPKSLDIGKAIDKLQGNEREVIGTKKTKDIRRSVAKDIEMGKTDRQGKFAPGSPTKYMEHTETKGNSPHEGWGTALKPAWENIGIYQKPISALEPVMSNRATERIKPALEPITVARKPFPGTVAANVLEWGTGGINIDGCRVENEAMTEGRAKQNTEGRYAWNTGDDTTKPLDNPEQHIGRFPANLIHDGSPEVLALFPESKGSGSSKDVVDSVNSKTSTFGSNTKRNVTRMSDAGSAARFFKSIPIENICSLCCLTLDQKHNTMSKTKENVLCKNTHAQIAENYSLSTQATKECTAQENAMLNQNEKNVRFVKYAGNLCDSCAIDIVQNLVAISEARKGAQSQLESQAIQGFITGYKKCTLLQNLARYVENLDSIDTTQTTTSLLKLFGCVRPAIKSYIQKIKKSEPKRFAYIPKASKRDRGRGNNHPTVKPISLIRYLCRLVTPPGGTVLDPFFGSGTMGVAAYEEGFKFVGIEMGLDNCEIAAKRIEQETKQLKLF